MKRQLKNIPSECKMPDLSGLKTLKGLLFVQLLIGEKGVSRNISLYRKNFIRILDKSLEEYGKAREAIIEQSAEPSRALMLEFTDHIETCINAVARLYKLLDRIKTEKASPPLPQNLRKLAETQNKSLTNMRNAVEHMDKIIREDEIAPGQPIMLALNGEHDGVVISNCEIKFSELAIVLRTMHELAQYILTVKK